MVQDAPMRDKTFKMRLSEQDWDRLLVLAAFYETSAAHVVRILIKDRAEQVQVKPARKPTKRSK
ncbi:MAG: hypothetical protein WC911_10890 [Thermoleophilia bacterium]